MVPLEGDLDVASVPHLRALFDKSMAKGCQRIVLNMAGTSYVDSMGMALLLTTARRLHEAGGRLSLIGVSDSVYRQLVICRLVDFVPVSGTSPKPAVPALDPNVRPVWQGTMSVDPAQLGATRARLEQVLERTDLTPDEIFDLTLAGGEAMGNAVDHTCADGVLCSLNIYPDRVIVEVTDCGCGMDLAADEEPPENADAETLERGRGIKLMRMLADAVEISRKQNGEGTVVRLTKLITPIEMEQ